MHSTNTGREILLNGRRVHSPRGGSFKGKLMHVERNGLNTMLVRRIRNRRPGPNAIKRPDPVFLHTYFSSVEPTGRRRAWMHIRETTRSRTVEREVDMSANRGVIRITSVDIAMCKTDWSPVGVVVDTPAAVAVLCAPVVGQPHPASNANGLKGDDQMFLY